MADIHSFTAKVVGRNKSRIHLSPENTDAFMDYLDREGIPVGPYCVKGMCRLSVGNQKLIDAAQGVDRVQYSVKTKGARLIGVAIEPA
jgi:hypothetical protein